MLRWSSMEGGIKRERRKYVTIIPVLLPILTHLSCPVVHL
jgi:hypothetical protein